MLISVLCIRGRSDLVLGKGGRHSPKLLEIEDHLDNALRGRVCISSGPVWSQLSLMILWTPSNPGYSMTLLFYDSSISQFS